MYYDQIKQGADIDVTQVLEARSEKNPSSLMEWNETRDEVKGVAVFIEVQNMGAT